MSTLKYYGRKLEALKGTHECMERTLQIQSQNISLTVFIMGT